MVTRKPPPDSLAALAVSGLSFCISCQNCRHRRRLHPYTLMLKMGWRATIQEIEARHVCSRCGQKAARVRRA